MSQNPGGGVLSEAPLEQARQHFLQGVAAFAVLVVLAGRPAHYPRGDALDAVVLQLLPQQAVEGGAVGDWIFVRTARKAEPLRARIERPGLAVIPAS